MQFIRLQFGSVILVKVSNILLILLMCYRVVIFILLLPGFIYRYVQKMNYQIGCAISVYIVLKLSIVSNYRA